jgi:hypothetical protein
MITALQLTRALGGRWYGGYGMARCVVHDDSNPSLSITDGKRGLILKCFAGCDWRDLRDEFRRRGLMHVEPAIYRAVSGKRFTESPTAQSDIGARTARALALWREAKPLGELAHKYLMAARRITGLSAVPNIHSVLRFHSRCPFGPGGALHPCIIALWTDTLIGEPKAIHRTALKPDGSKLDRMSLGPTGGCVIRLWPDEAVTRGLVIGEGLETVLYAATRHEHRGTLLRPAWVAGDATHIANFPVLPGIEALTILSDNDLNGRGQHAAYKCACRWVAAGRELIVLTPNVVDTDFNDIESSS